MYCYRCVRRVAHYYLRDYMQSTMQQTTAILELVFLVIKHVDKRLFDFIVESQVNSAVAAPWILTWFSHSLEQFADVARLYDFFLAYPPIM